MPSSSQEPRGPGLSSSLVSDFRAIMNSLEQEKSGRGPDEAGPIIIAAKPVSRPAAPAERPQSRPAPEAAARSYGEVRERLNALGDVSDMLAKRGAAAPGAAMPAAKADAAEAAKRKRGFGTSARQSEAEMRRKRGAPKDVITWQRLGVLAIFVAMVGGGVVALQSLAAREEARVAPDVIGNAAVASVAPSAPASAALAVAPAETPAPVPSVVPQSTSRQAAAAQPAAATALQSSVAASLPPVLRDAPPPFQIASTTPPGVTAFASSAAAAAPVVEPAMVAAKPNVLPEKVPLPPRAPTRHASAAAADSAADDAADEADSRTGFGGAPIGNATIRSTVTMRAAPKRGAAPVGNLSAGEKVELVACRGWCEVISDGKRGFIYKSFVDAASTARAEAAADAATTAQ